MITKYVYPIVLLIVVSAWFGHSTNKIPIVPKPQVEDDKNVTPVVSDISSTFGIRPNGWTSGGQCNLEYIDGRPFYDSVISVSRNKIAKLTGWAMDAENLRLPDKVVVRFTNSDNKDFFAVSRAGLLREDVKNYFNLPGSVSASGFELLLAFEDIPLGQYALTLIITFGDVTYICDNGRKIDFQ